MKLTREIADSIKSKYNVKGFISFGSIDNEEIYLAIRKAGGKVGMPLYFYIQQGTPTFFKSHNELAYIEQRITTDKAFRIYWD